MFLTTMLHSGMPNGLTIPRIPKHETHYSIMKAMEAMAVPTFYEVGMEKYPRECPLGTDWPLAVPCEGGDAGSGTIDIKALSTLVDFLAKGHPIIVIFNYALPSREHMMRSKQLVKHSYQSSRKMACMNINTISTIQVILPHLSQEKDSGFTSMVHWGLLMLLSCKWNMKIVSQI